jgi:parallel beta-helix repeat protein
MAQTVNGNFIAPTLPTVFIQADGSIAPDNAPIKRVGNTYTLTDNLIGYNINIQCDNIVLDGARHILQGQSYLSDLGISAESMQGRHNITIKNFIVQQFSEGIHLTNVSNCTVTSNIVNCVNSISIAAIYDCFNNEVSHNSLFGYTKYSYHSGSAISVTSSNSSISKNYIQDYHDGIDYYSGLNNQIFENQINCDNGMTLLNVSYSKVSRNNLVVTGQGIVFRTNSSLNQISNNNILGQSTAQGISMTQSSNNSFYHNNIENTMLGIGITISSPKIANATSNTFCQNNLKNNNQMVSVPDSLPNSWDSDSIGNYWGNYLTKYPDAKEIDTSGIYDKPYTLNQSNIDNFPLVNPASLDLLSPSLVTPAPTPTIVPTNAPTSSASPSNSINPSSTPESSQTITPSPQIPEFSSTAILLLTFIMLIGVLFSRRRNVYSKKFD